MVGAIEFVALAPLCGISDVGPPDKRSRAFGGEAVGGEAVGGV